MYGQQYREQISEVIRHAAELCDCLQCFFLIHSMGGGQYFCLLQRCGNAVSLVTL